MKNKKRILLTALALVLVCLVSVVGTFAYLTNRTATVTNTFIAAGGGKLLTDDAGFSLQEHKVAPDANGKYDYVLEDGAKVDVTENTYTIMPGMTIPKDPYVTLNNKTTTPAYLYVEVINKLGFSTTVDGAETLNVDATNWKKLDGVTGTQGGDVYVYTAGGANAAVIISDVGNVDIIAGNKFTVNKDVDPTAITDATLTFNAYLAQATMGEVTDAAEIFVTCFGN